MKLLPGQPLLRRFVVEEHHRRGGMGDIYRGYDRERDAPVAIKVCLLPSDDNGWKRFRREASILATIDHPRVVRLLAHDALEDGTPYYIMEFIDEPTLDQVFRRRGRMPVLEATSAIESLLEGLSVLHMRGIFHRDVTPKNLAIDPTTLRVKILDLGLAKSLVGHEVGLTQDGATVGTPAYMAPEQTMGFGDARADVYAAGLLLFQLLTGARPFEDHGKRELATRIAFPAPPARAPRGEAPFPTHVVSLLARALSRDPDDRPADAMQFHMELLRGSGGAASARDAAPAIASGRRPSLATPAPANSLAFDGPASDATEPGFGAVALSGLRYVVGVRTAPSRPSRPANLLEAASRETAGPQEQGPEAATQLLERRLRDEVAGEVRVFPPDIVVAIVAADAVDALLCATYEILGTGSRIACEPLNEEALGPSPSLDDFGPEVAAVLGDLLT